MKRVLFALVLTTSLTSVANAETTTWGQLKSGIASETARVGLASSAEANTSTSGMLMSELFSLARETGYRVPAISSDPDYPSADDAQRLVRWHNNFMTYLDTDVALGELVDCVNRVLSGDTTDDPQELSWEQMFELARMTGYRVVSVGSTENPSASDAQRLVRWRNNFHNYLDASVSLETLVDCLRVIQTQAA